MHNSLIILLLAALAAASPAAGESREPGEAAIPADDVDRELVVRFSRAYGMAKGAVGRHEDVDEDASLEHPERLEEGLREEIYQIMDSNGVTEEEWQGMLARMDKDRALRDRVESLSTPFRYE